VDGKKKSISGTNADIAEHGRQESNENEKAFKEKAQRQETTQEDILRPRAISNLQAHGQESERKFTPMDVDGVEINNEGAETDVKRNPDGSVCEDCN